MNHQVKYDCFNGAFRMPPWRVCDWIGSVIDKGSPSGNLVQDTSVSCWITAAFHVHSDHQLKYDCFKVAGCLPPCRDCDWVDLVTGQGSPSGKLDLVTDTCVSC